MVPVHEPLFGDEGPFTMRLLHFQRTFVERMFAIHGKVDAYIKTGREIAGYARHYDDLYCLAERAEVLAMLRSDEYSVIKVDYDRTVQSISRTATCRRPT
jgi:hypothetical protein